MKSALEGDEAVDEFAVLALGVGHLGPGDVRVLAHGLVLRVAEVHNGLDGVGDLLGGSLHRDESAVPAAWASMTATGTPSPSEQLRKQEKSVVA